MTWDPYLQPRFLPLAHDRMTEVVRRTTRAAAGHSKIYKGPGDDPTPVSDAIHYAYRDRRLFKLCAVEFNLT